MIELLNKFITDEDRKHYILDVLKVLFTLVLSLKIYVAQFGDIALISLGDDYFTRVFNAFKADSYFIPITIYIIVWHFFFYFLQLPLLFFKRWVLSVIARASSPNFSKFEGVIVLIMVSPLSIFAIKRFQDYLFKSFEYFNFMSRDSENKLTIHDSFKSMIELIENDKDKKISTSYLRQSLLVLFQFSIVYFAYVKVEITIPFYMNLIILLSIIMYCWFLLFGIAIGTGMKYYSKEFINEMQSLVNSTELKG